MNKIKSLMWLRWQYLISNKILLFVCVFTPIFDFYILQAIPMIHGEIYFLNMGLSMIYSMTAGSFTAMMVGEEKEKKNLPTLIVSGVTEYEYILTVIAFPFFFSILACVLFPLFFGIKIPNWGLYLVIAILTSLIFILLIYQSDYWLKHKRMQPYLACLF